MGRPRIPDHIKEARKRDKVRKEIRNKALDRRTLVREYEEYNASPLAATFEDNKTKEYFLCWIVTTADWTGKVTRRYVPINRLRVKQLHNCVKLTANAHTEGNLSEKSLEIVLDYLYAELNKRLNKTEKKLDAET